MTKSTITRERIQRIIRAINSEAYDEEEIREWLSSDEIMELSRMALAAMDSEPVQNHIGSKNSLDAIVSFIKSKSNPTVKCYEEVSEQLFKDNCHGIHSHVIEYILKLGEELEDLRTEQAEMPPVQPVADSEPVAEVYQAPNVGICAALGPSIRMLCPLEPGTKLYRHAQPAQVVPEEATPDSIEILASGRCRDHVVYQWDEDQRNAAADSWNAFRAAMLQAVPLTNEGDIQAGNSPANPDCWCRACRPVTLNDMRFVVCPDCGNKRCPRANDHRNACTGSNEPGQEGSAYPDTPREVK
ncbi:TPA: hypothetical protein ACHV5P_000855 [Klebsiella variicola]